jgi:uncharacterized protein (TIGR03083 family)
MTAAPLDYTAAIAEHSAGFAAAADGNLDAEVRCCPGWTVADLVAHLTEVHWFWATIADERLSEPPDDSRRPPRAPRDQLIGQFRTGADRLVRVLAAADPADSAWTWAPAQQDIAFIARHQVQEAAVHHWDAAGAAGRAGAITIAAPVAADAVDEFLTFSVSSDADPAEPARPALNGRFALRCTDADAAWTISDGGAPGTVAHQPGAAAGLPAVGATASDLLLWLYGRVSLATDPVPSELIGRFRALTFTD